MARIAAVGTLVLAGIASSAGAVTIDSFTTNQAAVSDPPGGATSVTGGADIVGTRRGLFVDLRAGAGPVSASVAAGALSFAVTPTTPDSRGEAIVTWDGDTNPNVLSPTGLGGIDLTTGGHSGFRILVNAAGAGTELELDVHTDGANSSSAARRLAAAIAAPTSIFVPFAEFRDASGTGADFASVGAIVMTVRGTEISATIDLVETTAPVLAATKVDALIVDNDGDTRADPGDRVRYTVTLTNTGNQAATVDLSDNVDANTTLVTGSTSSTPIARNDQYGWFGNVTFSADGTPFPTLLANDSDPDGDTVTVQAASFPASSAQGGTLTLVSAATGEFSYSPPAGFSGVDSFTYTIVDDNSNSSTATAYIALEGVVWFVDDSNTTPPHLGTFADPFQSLAGVNGGGDPDQPGDIIFLYDDDVSGPYTGGHTMEADQELVGQGVGLTLGGTVIVPAGASPAITNAAGAGITLSTNGRIRGLAVMNTSGAGITGTNFGTLTISTVDVTNVAGTILDLDTGALTASFGPLSSSGSAGQRGLNLVGVSGTLSSTFTQSFNPTGQGIRVANSPGVSLSFGTTQVTDFAIGSGATATAIDLATGNAGATFNFGSLAITADGAGLVANASGTINISGAGNTIAATGGAAVDITSTSLGSGATFSTLSSTNSTGKGVNLDTVTGPFTANGGAIGNSSGVCFDVNGGSSNITFAGTVTCAAASRLVEITGRTGGTVTLSGNLSATGSSTGIHVANNSVSGSPIINFTGASKVLNTGANAAVTLDNNDVATINFTGGGLDIDTTSGTGFNAINGAAGVTVQGGGSTITTTTGTALNVASTTIGAAGLTFQSINSNGGTNGIVLNTTNASGGLTVSGTGGAGTGGTIQNKTGPGILLTSTSFVNLSSMIVTGGGDDGIRGSAVTGLSLTGVQVTANGNAAGEAGIELANLLGSSTWSNLTVSGSAEDNAVIRNSSGTLTSLSVTSSAFSANSAIGNDGLLVEASGTATMTVSVTSSTFSAHRGDHFQGSAANSGVLDVVFSNNTLSGGHALALGQGIAISAATGVPGFAGTVDYNIDNNIINGSILSAITANLGTSAAGSNMRGTISGNSIGTVGSFQSGSTQASGITVEAHGNGTHTTSVTGNAIRQTFDRGINVLANDGGGTLNMTVTGNNASHSDGINSREGFFLNNGSADPNIFGVPDQHFVCLVLGGAGALRNTLTHGPGAPDDFRLRQRFNSTIRLPGYAGAATDTAAVVTFVNGNNISATGSATVNSPPGGGFVGGAACPLPL